MEIKGKIIEILDLKSGTSRNGNEWRSQEYVIETLGQFPKRCVFTVFGSDKIDNFALMKGEVVTVKLDIDAREYNGRWYNDIKAWAVERDARPSQPQGNQAYYPNKQTVHEESDLPF